MVWMLYSFTSQSFVAILSEIFLITHTSTMFISFKHILAVLDDAFIIEGSFNLHQTRTAQQKWHNVLLNKNINHHFPIDGRLVESLLEKDGSGDILAETRGQG
ncbi:hypothetical protein V6N12_041810 [Hibiscus sabdariffa]|uniref:Uncharacterized protein n=1 Tax=Hibiscus sabdariffa TaxID=183260 RepID=A0ABR2EEI7_9ROSI